MSVFCLPSMSCVIRETTSGCPYLVGLLLHYTVTEHTQSTVMLC